MLTQRTPVANRFTRRDVPRLAIAAGILILALTAILGIDILPEPPLDVAEGQLATRDIVAPRALDYESQVQTDAARAAAEAAVPPQYTFTSENAIAIAAAQQLAFEDRVSRVDTTFSAELTPAGRKTLLQTAVPDLTETANATLAGLDAATLGGRPDRIRADPRCHPADRAARLGGRRHARPPCRPDGGRARRGRADAGRGAHLPADRAQLLVQPAALGHRQGQGRRGRRARPGNDPPGRGHRPQRHPVERHGHREDRRPRPAGDRPRRRQLRGLAAARGPRRRHPAGLDLAVPAGPVAPRQRARADRPAGRRCDPGAQDHGRPADPAVLPADGRDRDPPDDPARRVDRHDRHRDRGHHRRSA